jgi:hypothetical protein
MTDRREESAPRSVGAVRDEQAADRQRREAGLGTSWTSVILGWLAALGARYGLEFDLESVPGLCERFGVTFG